MASVVSSRLATEAAFCSAVRGVFPPMNVFSGPDGSVIRLEVPGMSPEHLTVESQGRTLTVSGKREATALAGGSFHRRERGSGQFSRSVQLPADLDFARAEASYKQGMLDIRIPKKEEAKPHQTSVRAAWRDFADS